MRGWQEEKVDRGLSCGIWPAKRLGFQNLIRPSFTITRLADPFRPDNAKTVSVRWSTGSGRYPREALFVWTGRRARLFAQGGAARILKKPGPVRDIVNKRADAAPERGACSRSSIVLDRLKGKAPKLPLKALSLMSCESRENRHSGLPVRFAIIRFHSTGPDGAMALPNYSDPKLRILIATRIFRQRQTDGPPSCSYEMHVLARIASRPSCKNVCPELRRRLLAPRPIRARAAVGGPGVCTKGATGIGPRRVHPQVQP